MEGGGSQQARAKPQQGITEQPSSIGNRCIQVLSGPTSTLKQELETKWVLSLTVMLHVQFHNVLLQSFA